MPSIESFFFVFVANSSPIDCQLSLNNHPVLIARKSQTLQMSLSIIYRLQVLNSGAFLFVELNQDFWILYPHHVMRFVTEGPAFVAS
jgi:hypothetical protein